MKNALISSFAKNIGLIVALNLLIKPGGLLLEAELQDIIGNAEWGKLASFFSLGFLLSVITDFGINQYYTKAIAEDPTRIKELAPTMISIKGCMVLIYPIIVVFIAKLIGIQDDLLTYVGLLAFTNGMIQFNNFFRANFQGFQLYKLDAFASNLDKLLLIIGLSGLLIFHYNFDNEIGMGHYVSARLCAVLVTGGVLIALTFSRGLWHRPKLIKNKISPIIKSSIPFALITVLYSFNEKVDQVMVERLSDTTVEAGIYSAAYRWLDALMMYLWIILPMLFARFSFHETGKERKELLLKTGMVITAVPLLIVTGFSFWHSEVLFVMFNNSPIEEVNRMSSSFSILSIALGLHGLFAILSTFLTSSGHTKFVNRLLIVAILLNMTLNFVYIPENGALAAAWTTVISTILISSGYIIYLVSKVDIKLPWLSWLKVILGFISYIGCMFWFESMQIHWFIGTFVSAGLFMAIIILTKTVRISDLKRI